MTYNYTQYQVHTEPVSTSPETVTEDRWHQPWSEPIRFRAISTACNSASGYFGTLGAGTNEAIFEDKWHFAWSEPVVKIKQGLRTGDQEFFEFQPVPIIDVSWFNNLSEPIVKIKQGLRTGDQEFFEFQPMPIINISWFNWYSEPVRKKPAVLAGDQQYEFIQPFPIIDVSWFNWMSEPVRTKPRLREGDQAFLFFQPRPIIDVSWFNWYSEPVRKKPGEPPQVQPFFQFQPSPVVSFSWFGNLSDPVRVKLRLRDGDQQTEARNTYIPLQYTAQMNATETKDIFSGVLSFWNIVVQALVDLVELWTTRFGKTGLIENTVVSARVAVSEVVTQTQSGTPITTVASAIVSIIQV